MAFRIRESAQVRILCGIAAVVLGLGIAIGMVFIYPQQSVSPTIITVSLSVAEAAIDCPVPLSAKVVKAQLERTRDAAACFLLEMEEPDSMVLKQGLLSRGWESRAESPIYEVAYVIPWFTIQMVEFDMAFVRDNGAEVVFTKSKNGVVQVYVRRQSVMKPLPRMVMDALMNSGN